MPLVHFQCNNPTWETPKFTAGYAAQIIFAGRGSGLRTFCACFCLGTRYDVAIVWLAVTWAFQKCCTWILRFAAGASEAEPRRGFKPFHDWDALWSKDAVRRQEMNRLRDK